MAIVFHILYGVIQIRMGAQILVYTTKLDYDLSAVLKGTVYQYLLVLSALIKPAWCFSNSEVC